MIGVVAPFALGFGSIYALNLGGEDQFGIALFVGAAMTATSVGITARVFGDLGALKSREAKTIIGAAVVDDILGLLILTVVAGVLGSSGDFSIVDLGDNQRKGNRFFSCSSDCWKKTFKTNI